MGAPRIERLDRNILINGMMKYWQRGASINAAAAGGAAARYAADRWHVQNESTQIMNMTRQADVPSWSHSDYSFRVGNAGALGDISANVDDYVSFQQKVEGLMFARARKKVCTLVFSVKPTVAGDMTVSFFDPGTNQYASKVSLDGGVWQRKKILVDFTSGTFPTDNNAACFAHFSLAASDDISGSSSEVWEGQGAPLNRGIAGQTNFFELAGQFVNFSDIMLVEGDFVTDYDGFPEFSFAGRDLIEELQICQRYYEKSYHLEDPPGTTGYEVWDAHPRCVFNGSIWTSREFLIEKRAIGAVGTIYNPRTGVVGQCDYEGAADAASIVALSAKRIVILTSVNRNTLIPSFAWTVDAEL